MNARDTDIYSEWICLRLRENARLQLYQGGGLRRIKVPSTPLSDLALDF